MGTTAAGWNDFSKEKVSIFAFLDDLNRIHGNAQAWAVRKGRKLGRRRNEGKKKRIKRHTHMVTAKLQLNKHATRLALSPAIRSRKLSHTLIAFIVHTITLMPSGLAIGACDGNARGAESNAIADHVRGNEGSAIRSAAVERVGGLLLKDAKEEGLITRAGEQGANLGIVVLVLGGDGIIVGFIGRGEG